MCNIKTTVITIVAIFIIYKFWSEENFISYLFVKTFISDYKGTGENNAVEIEFSRGVSKLIIVLVCVFVITSVLWIKLQEYECGLYFLRSSVIILLIAEISMVIFFDRIVNENEIMEYANKQLPNLMNSYCDSYFSRTLWDLIQSSLKCCGYKIVAVVDWHQHNFSKCSNNLAQLPLSCCDRLPTNQTICLVSESSSWYQNLCQNNLKQFITYFYSIYIMVFLGLAITKISAIFVANYYFEQLTKTFTCAPTKIARRKNIGEKSCKKDKKCDSIHLGVV